MFYTKRPSLRWTIVGACAVLAAASAPSVWASHGGSSDVWDDCASGRESSYSITIDSPGAGDSVGTSVVVTYSTTGWDRHHVDIVAAGIRYAGLDRGGGSQLVSLTGSNDTIYAEVYCEYNHIAASTQIVVNTAPPPTPTPTPPPAPLNDAAFVSYGGPTSVGTNQVFSASLTMRNTGTTTWTTGGNYRLGALNAFWGVARATWSFVDGVPSTGPVAPNSTATFVFNATAPSTANTYAMAWQMLIEGVAWFGASTPPLITVANQLPTGFHDAASCDGTATWGWARDPDNAPAPVGVHIYRDGPAGSGGVFTAAVTADQLRSDLPFPDKNHGFSFAIPASLRDGLPHTYYAYAINSPAGANPQLGGSPHSVACYLPPVITISAAPNPTGFGAPSTVTWSTTNPTGTSCTGSGGTPGWAGPRTTAGSFNTGPLAANTVFTLSCTNPSGTDTKSVTVAILPPPPPVASITNVTDTDYCAAGAGMKIDWRYESMALPIDAYQVQVLGQSGGMAFDTGRVVYADPSGTDPQTVTTGSVTTSQGQPGTIGFSTAYTIRAKVWDASGQESPWSAPFAYSTKPGPWPTVDFSYSPSKPAAKQPIQFTDLTSENPTAWTWSFGDGGISVEQNPLYTFGAEGAYVVTLQATNAAGTCEATKSLGITKPIPSYREVLPGQQTTTQPDSGGLQ